MTYNDEQVEQFYGDIELEMKRIWTQHTIVIGDSNAKSETKQRREQAGKYGVGDRNNRGGMLVRFAEKAVSE